MDASKPAPPTTTNALAAVTAFKAPVRTAPTPPARPAAKPAVNPQARHPEDRIRNYPSGANPKPTKAFAGRTSAPASDNTSGMERAMGALADKMHAPKKRR